MPEYIQKNSPNSKDHSIPTSIGSTSNPLTGFSERQLPVQRAKQGSSSLSPDKASQLISTIRGPGVAQLQKNAANATGMPDRLKAGVESLSGISMDNVKVNYNSPSPGRIGAAAYAQGTDIHIGPGQEKHLPHEAWHVVQQAQGRVQPTKQLKGAAINDDAGLEKEADVMGSRAAHSHSGGAVQLKAMEGGLPQVKQLARGKTANPVLANGRDLLKDSDRLMAGQEREDKPNGDFLDTTYDQIEDNLLLDIDMLYEENLQRAIEHDSFFTHSIKKIVDIIHGKLGIRSIKQDSTNLKQDRIDGVLGTINEKLGASEDSLITLEKLIKDNWQLDMSGISGENAEETKRMTGGYVKLLKMLETQLPYFGGSQEYDHNEQDEFEYWIYHMSSLTKDPDRQYDSSSSKSGLMKPLIDYRTHKDGLVPHQNQRNLGTGIIEMKWEELPSNFQKMIETDFEAKLEEFKGKFKQLFASTEENNRNYTARLPWVQGFDEQPGLYDSIIGKLGAEREKWRSQLPEEETLAKREEKLLAEQKELEKAESELRQRQDHKQLRENLKQQSNKFDQLVDLFSHLTRRGEWHSSIGEMRKSYEAMQSLINLKALKEDKAFLEKSTNPNDPFWLQLTEKRMQHKENSLKSSDPMRRIAASMEWTSLPKSFQRIIQEEFAGNSQKAGNLERINTKFAEKSVKDLWNKSSEDERKIIYGDIMRLPWSDAHKDRYPYQPQFPEDSKKQLSHELISYLAPINVAGVMGNILESPAKAKERYKKELGEKFKGNLQDFKHKPFGEEPVEDDLDQAAILEEFEKKHQDWYDSAKENHKPIIGGISGHTLGYLNLYEDALTKAEVQSGKKKIAQEEPGKYPSMEVLRAAMLGALVGDKRHHSYDEVMTASHNMPTHDSTGQLKYKHKDSYEDVLLSNQSNIKTAADHATKATAESVNNPEASMVLSRLMRKDEQDEVIKAAIRAYLQDNLKQSSKAAVIKEVKKRTQPAQ